MTEAQRKVAAGRDGAGYRNAAALFRALGHPVRLQIVALLGYGEACVCHLQAILKQRQPYVSQQLMALRDAGLVGDRRDGTMVYYRLTTENTGALLAWAQAELARQEQAAPSVTPPHEMVKGCPCPKCSPCESGTT